MGVAQPIQRLSEVEYLAIERAAEFKSEFFDGEMFAISGGTPTHSLIATNMAREFGNRLKGKPCVPFNSDLRLKVQATGFYTYPDLSVICGPLITAPNARDTVVNPTVIVEVLSDSTEAYDRGKKFEQYRQIESLREYLVVNQREAPIEQFIRQDNGEWLMREVAGLSSIMEIPSLGITISLIEVYANVEFLPGPFRQRAERPA